MRDASGGKVVIQTPPLPCAVRPQNTTFSQGWSFELRMPQTDPLATKFAAWLDSVLASAIAWGGMHESDSRDPMPAVSEFAGVKSVRVTAFSDALLFDTDGNLTGDPSKAKACSCLLELQGLWTSPARWGIRWRVSQVKMERGARANDDALFSFVDDD